MKSSIESYIASKDPGNRFNGELQSLLPWFRKYGKNVLRDATDEVLVKILQNCTYEKFQKDNIIILEGEIGDNFYILIEGKVNIYVRDNDTPNDDFRRKRSSLNNKEFLNLLGRCVLTEGEGYSFGEYALMEEDRVRNASVVAAEDCCVIVVNLITYNNSLKDLEKNILTEREEFIKNNSLFKDYNTNIKKIIKMSLKKVKIYYQSNLVTQGNKWTGLIFITKGSGQLVIEVNKHENQYPEYFPLDFSQYNQQYNAFSEIKVSTSTTDPTEKEIVDTLTSKLIFIKRNKDYAAVESYVQHSSTKLCTVQPGEIIGDVELLFNLKTNLYSLTCLEETDAFILESVHIDRVLKSTNPSSLYDHLKKLICIKLDYREKYFTKVPIPFMLYLKTKLYFKPTLFSKEFPKMITSKELPTIEEEWQHLLKMYERNRAELLIPNIRGSVFLKDLMKKNALMRKRTKMVCKPVDIQDTIQALDSFPIRQKSIYRLQKISRDPVHLMELIQKEINYAKVKKPKIELNILSRQNTHLTNDDRLDSIPIESSFAKLKTLTERTFFNETDKNIKPTKKVNTKPSKEYISNLQNSQVKFLNNFCSEKSQYDIEINKPKLKKNENIRTHFLPDLHYENETDSKDLPKDEVKIMIKQRPSEALSSPYKILKHNHSNHKIINKMEDLKVSKK